MIACTADDAGVHDPPMASDHEVSGLFVLDQPGTATDARRILSSAVRCALKTEAGKVPPQRGVSTIQERKLVRTLEGAAMNALQRLVERNCRRAELQALILSRTGRHHTLGTKR